MSGRRWLLGALAAAALAAVVGNAQATPAAPKSSAPATALEREAAFQEAMALMETGRPDRAQTILRSLLAAEPRLVRVRLELARALLMSGEFEEARRQFVTVLSGEPEPPPEVRRTVLGLIRQIDARTGVDWDFSLGVGRHPEAGRSYDSDEITLNIFGQPAAFRLERPRPPSMAVFADGAVIWRPDASVPIADGQVTGFSRLRARTIEAGGSSFDERSVEGAVGARWTGGAVTAEAGPIIRWEEEGQSSREVTVGGRLAGEGRSGDGRRLSAAMEAGASRDSERPSRDGTTARARVALTSGFQGRGEVGVGAFGGVRFAEEDWDSSFEFGADALARLDVEGGWTVEGRVYALRFAERDIQPGLVERRRDVGLGTAVRVTRNNVFIAGRFTPFVEVSAGRRWSEIDALSYIETGFIIGIDRAW